MEEMNSNCFVHYDMRKIIMKLNLQVVGYPEKCLRFVEFKCYLKS